MGLSCVSSFSFDRCCHSLVIHAFFLFGSRPLAFRLISTVVFSHISICESFCIDRSGCRHQRLGVGTVENIMSIQLFHRTPRCAYAVAQPHEHSDIDRSDIYSQESSFEIRLGKSSNSAMFIRQSRKRTILLCVWNLCSWVALKKNVKSARILWIITKVCSNQRLLPGLLKKCQKQKALEKLDAETLCSWSSDMECYAKKRVERLRSYD